MNRRSRRATAEDQRPACPRRGRSATRVAALAVVALVAGATSAWAGGSGGIGGGGTAVVPDTGYVATAGCPDRQFGRRTLRLGDCGADVQTLHWLLRARAYSAAPTADEFKRPTATSVRAFQRRQKLAADGVVDGATSSALVADMRRQRATWYGPGFFGNEHGMRPAETRRTTGVAHRSLPCGTKVVIRYRGRYARTKVIDRGPYANGAKWDLAQATAVELGFEYTDEIRVAPIPRR